MEALRAAKDEEIKGLHAEIESQRSKYELHINSLELTIKELRLTIQTHETTIDGLNNELKVRVDVEEQLRALREHEAQMIAAKAELQKELDTAAEYINELEAKYLKSQ